MITAIASKALVLTLRSQPTRAALRSDFTNLTSIDGATGICN